jgi:hypothetical protein
MRQVPPPNRQLPRETLMLHQDYPTSSRRWSLDALFGRLLDPTFIARFRRRLSFRETSRHASPLMLAVSGPDSMYVREWREHARTCSACRALFKYFGLSEE